MSKITVINPRGQHAPIQWTALAPRLDSLKAKTVYIVDMRWPYTEQFTEELKNILSEKYPDTQFVRREKAGPYGEADPQLWQEIATQGDAAIIGTGH